MPDDGPTTTAPRTRFSRAAAKLKQYLGPLAWGTAIVFVIQRGADVANLACKVFLGRVLPPLDFGAVEPILATIGMLSLPAGVIFGTAVKSISRLRSQGKDAQCRALIHDLQRVALIGSMLTIGVTFLLRDFILTRLHLEDPAFIWMIAIMFATAWWAPLILSIIRAEHRYRLLMFSNLLGPFLLVLLTVTLVGALQLGLQGAIIARALSGVVIITILMLAIRTSHRGPREAYPEERALMLRMLPPMAVLAVTGTLALNFDRLFVRNFLLHDSAGLSAIFMLGQIPRLFIAPIGFVLPPAVGAALMSLSTIVVAANAQLLRRLDLSPDAH